MTNKTKYGREHNTNLPKKGEIPNTIQFPFSLFCKQNKGDVRGKICTRFRETLRIVQLTYLLDIRDTVFLNTTFWRKQSLTFFYERFISVIPYKWSFYNRLLKCNHLKDVTNASHCKTPLFQSCHIETFHNAIISWRINNSNVYLKFLFHLKYVTSL